MAIKKAAKKAAPKKAAKKVAKKAVPKKAAKKAIPLVRVMARRAGGTDYPGPKKKAG
jgi:hypothetical protein